MPHDNRLERLIGYFSPAAAHNRAVHRLALQRYQNYYDGAKSSRLRKSHRTGDVSPNAITRGNAVAIRDESRALERNHDIARGVIRTLVNNIVGPNGIGIEPQPRKKNGDIHEEYRAALLDAWTDWCKRPEVTWRHSWSKTQRMLCRTWVRDGEAFAQKLIGPVAKLDHGTKVPFSLEMLEPDMVPWDQDSEKDRIIQGVKVNAWGRPSAYLVYKDSPDSFRSLSGNFKEIPASRMIHLASLDRIGQVRGVSEFAAVLTRLHDIKDYEESERIAAKVAASLTAFVRKGSAEAFDPNAYLTDDAGNRRSRELNLSPGMIIDDLMPGEEVGMIDSNRPNPNVVTFRQGQLRAIAAGIGASYSSISRDYNGSYSAQRQELVEQWTNYATLTDEFVCDMVEPVWGDFVRIANITGVVPLPRDVDSETMTDAMYVAQSMPWIDPMKEAEASVVLAKAGFASEYELIRKRGGSPDETLKQIVKWREKVKAAGLVLSSDAATEQPPKPEPVKPEPQAQAPNIFNLHPSDVTVEGSTVNVAPAAITVEKTEVNVSPAAVNVEAPEIVVNTPEVRVDGAQITNNIASPRGAVRKDVVTDDLGNIVSVTETPIEG